MTTRRFYHWEDVYKTISKYEMYQDLPHEIVQRKKQIMATIKKAKVNKDQAAFSKAQANKVFVRDKRWPEGKTSIFLCSTPWINLGK